MKRFIQYRPVFHRLFLALMLSWGTIAPAAAVEGLTLRLGPFEQSIKISDLERFVNSGELPASLKPFSMLMTPKLRQFLSQRLQLDPKLTDKFLQDWLRSPMSEQFVRALRNAIPNITIEQLQAAISIAARQANGLSVIGVLRAVPGETVTIDATSAVALALQFNPSYWQSEALGPLLERELKDSNTRFNPTIDPAAKGSQRVRQETLIFEDKKRDRTIPADLYYGENSQGPLVVMSHGFGSDRRFLIYLARHLASHGITVAALEHPGSNITWVSEVSISDKPKDIISASEFVNRPKDISFLLDELAELNKKPGSLQNKLNTKQVTVIGHSLGGYTALALAGAEVKLDELRRVCKSAIPPIQSPAEWLQCAAADLSSVPKLRDNRVNGAIALNPLVGQLFGKTGLSKVSVPTLVLASTEDAFTPAINHQLQPFTQLSGTKYLLTAIGATHLSVGHPDFLGTQITLLKERTGKEADPLRQLIRGVSLAFIKQQTAEYQTYEPFLTAGYAQSLSTSKLALRLNQELPGSVSQWLRFASVP